MKKKKSFTNPMWLSPRKVVFLPSKATFCSVCKQGIMLVAEQNKSITCFHCGEGCADALCFYCKHGISPYLLAMGGEPSCLRGKEGGHVKFCREFEPGNTFGEDWMADLEEGRREKAMEVFAKVTFEHCVDCEHWNVDGVYWFEKDRDIVNVHENKDAAFCSLGEKGRWARSRCESFKLDPSDAKFVEHQRKALPLYVEALKLLEQASPKGRF